MKKYLSIVGAALLAALALSAVGVGSASAALPEFLLETGKTYPVSITGTGGAGSLMPEKSSSEEIACTASKSTGSLINSTEASKVVITYTGCEYKNSLGSSCLVESGATEGEVKTVALKGKIGYVESVAKKVGMLLQPESGTEFVKMSGSCFSTTVTGSVICEATPTNVLQATGELSCRSGSTLVQEWKKFSGSATEDVLKAFGLLNSAINTTEKLTFGVKVELMA